MNHTLISFVGNNNEQNQNSQDLYIPSKEMKIIVSSHEKVFKGY